jgi:ribosomal protein S18 acetylase RimI-like enzyme
MIHNLDIRTVNTQGEIPIDLLLLADPSKDSIENYIENSMIYAAYSDDQTIGCYVISQLDDKTLEIKNIAVAEKYRKQGIGTILLKDAIQKSNAKGFERIIIGTCNSSFSQLYLYQKVGFRITDIIKDYFINNYKEPVWENGLQCKDKLVLTLDLKKSISIRTELSKDFQINPIQTDQRDTIKSFITKNWGSHMVVSKGQVHNVTELPGFISIKDGQITGLITYNILKKECEIVTLDSKRKNLGIGTQLIDKVLEVAKHHKCKRVWLITTNDNIKAIRFYQKRGFEWIGFYKDSIQESRKLKPEIPEFGFNNLPVKHEIEFEFRLKQKKTK